jgi:hypothetical protein
VKPIRLIGIWVTGILGAAVLGAVTNFVNAQVSELYFRQVMRWEHVSQISRAIVAQGVFEGLLCGLVLSTIFATAAGMISRGECPYVFGVRFVGGLCLAAFVCWVLGGLLGIVLAALSPEFYRATFAGVPEAAGERLRFAWVGGSIWGLQFGGAGVTFVFLALFRAAWRQRIEEASKI